MESERPSLRERKKKKTRQALLDSADRLFAARGYEQTTLDDICDAADVSLRTFFRYFPSKLDLALERSYKNASRRKAGLMSPSRTVDTLTFLRGSYAEMAREFGEDPYALQRFKLLRDEPALTAKTLLSDAETENVITASLRAELDGPNAELRARLVAAMVVSGVRSAVITWMGSGGASDLERAVGEVLDAVEELALPWLSVRSR